MTTKEFEEYLHRSLESIYRAYVDTYGEDKAYLSMCCAKKEEGEGVFISANNNHWESGPKFKLQCFWGFEDEQD